MRVRSDVARFLKLRPLKGYSHEDGLELKNKEDEFTVALVVK